jgi:hypothetical protein
MKENEGSRDMKIYLGGESPWPNWQAEGLGSIIKRRCLSYWYHGFKIGNRLSEEVKLSHACGMDLFLDSGAYSAHTKQQTIPVDSYASFINQHGNIFSVIANLDDIGDTGPKSWDNLKALESMGCTVLPVFHCQDDIVYLKKMLDQGYPFIALGGMVGGGRIELKTWLDEVWKKYLINEDRTAHLKVHGFGLTDFELMTCYPWFSIDSTSWVVAGKNGGCVFYENGKLHKVVFSDESPVKRNLGGWHYDHFTDAEKAVVDKWLASHGVTAQQCAADYRFRHCVNAATYQGLETIGVEKLQVFSKC